MDFSDYRRGRKVRGPGTETSDSIPALLSKNEFVIKAKSAKKLGFKALNHMNRTGEIPMRMKKSNPRQASDMGAAMRGGGRMRMKGYQGGGVLDEFTKGFKKYIDPSRRPGAEGEVPPGPGLAPAPKPMPQPPADDLAPKIGPKPPPWSFDPDGGAKQAGMEAPKPKPWYRRFFAEGGGVMRCAACGGKMSAGGKCMSCGGAKAAGLKGYASGGHPGFKAVAAKIGKQPGIRNPGAVLAAASRGASPAAKRANPRLNRVKG